MESVQSAFNKFSNDVKLMGSSAFQPQSSPPPPPPPSASYGHSGVLVTRPPRQSVSLWTCSKLCAVCFVAGIVVGYTLKRRVRRWLSSLARRLKDD
ncbi:uncharacterized protein LOC110721828 [Chenopodium quinoa]|uniref:uncharacterized protein LOC110721828 n=1 Tax=Chenopodium quinoa TaxID=63459 RepID=UPI000B782ACB|nr:uncharacterized protein LOC110721828 [Chenopodium quinoa]